MLRALALCLVLGLAAVSCGGHEQRPSPAAWGRDWDDLQEQIPSARMILSADDPATTCDVGLADVRDARGGGLEPTPDEAIDEAYEKWTAAAETYLFDCPIHDEGMLGALARQAEDAALAVDRLVH